MIKLTEKLLSKISGGVLTDAAEDWIERNKRTVVKRAPIYLKPLADKGIDFVKNDSKTYDIPDLQALLKDYGIDTYDLT